MAEAASLAPSEALRLTPFSPGRTLSVSLSVFARNFLPFLIITLVINLPYIAVQTWLDAAIADAAASGESTRMAGANIAIFFVQTVTFGLVQAALTYGTVQELRGQRASLGDCFRLGLANAGNIVGGALRYGLLLGLATLLLIVPGIILYLRWWVFMPAMVVEKLPPSESFERSKMLTAGRRWALLGLSAAVFVVEIGVFIGVAMVIEGIVLDIVFTLLGILVTAFSSVIAAVGYYHLRVEKEGAMIDDIAKVFD